jgi:colicin import membrane protein
METEQEQVTALVHVEELTPMQLFAPGALNPILERIKAEVRAIETDISTPEGRKAIKSLAYKIARTKTFIDEQRKTLVADEKKRIAAIDAEGGRVWDELDALKDEVLAPYTQWKNAELARIQEHERRIRLIGEIGTEAHISIALVEHALLQVDELWDHGFQEFTKRAVQARENTLLHLDAERKNILREIAEKVELERLRAEAEEKARVEREAKIAEDARLKAEAEARRLRDAEAWAAAQREKDLLRVAAVEKARLERERKESEARLQKSLDDARAKAQRDKLAAEERERIAEANRIAFQKRAEAEREAAVIDERKRQEAIRIAEEAQRTAIARERARREADKAHRKQVCDEAVLALLGQVGELTNDSARAVVAAISAGLIPNVAITY